MSLVLFGLNHDTAPLQVREQVAFNQEALPDALRALMADASIEEAAILSTCNRTEVYCNTDSPERIAQWLAHFQGADLSPLRPHFYTRQNDEAVEHLFRVASGLDSMVLGEAQILGQVKEAARLAQEAGGLGWLLHRAFQQAFNVAKHVRTHTAIGSQTVSMAAAALRLASQVLGPIENQKVLLVGAGEMIELVATHLVHHRPKKIAIANRTLERAQGLAQKFNAEVLALAELHQVLPQFDLVISCTASTLPLIGKGMVERAIKERRHRPMVMIDLAVPRDIEAEVAEMEDVFLYTIDDLGRLVEAGRDVRLLAAREAETFIQSEVQQFSGWVKSRTVVPVIRQFRSRLDAYRQTELERARRALQKGASPEEVLEQLSLALTNKFLHHPTQILNTASGPDQAELLKWLPKLFPTIEEP